jgi:hypothetical protein
MARNSAASENAVAQHRHQVSPAQQKAIEMTLIKRERDEENPR